MSVVARRCVTPSRIGIKLNFSYHGERSTTLSHDMRERYNHVVRVSHTLGR